MRIVGIERGQAALINKQLFLQGKVIPLQTVVVGNQVWYIIPPSHCDLLIEANEVITDPTLGPENAYAVVCCGIGGEMLPIATAVDLSTAAKHQGVKATFFAQPIILTVRARSFDHSIEVTMHSIVAKPNRARIESQLVSRSDYDELPFHCQCYRTAAEAAMERAILPWQPRNPYGLVL